MEKVNKVNIEVPKELVNDVRGGLSYLGLTNTQILSLSDRKIVEFALLNELSTKKQEDYWLANLDNRENVLRKLYIPCAHPRGLKGDLQSLLVSQCHLEDALDFETDNLKAVSRRVQNLDKNLG